MATLLRLFRGDLRWSVMVCDASRTSKSQGNGPFQHKVWQGLYLASWPRCCDFWGNQCNGLRWSAMLLVAQNCREITHFIAACGRVFSICTIIIVQRRNGVNVFCLLLAEVMKVCFSADSRDSTVGYTEVFPIVYKHIVDYSNTLSLLVYIIQHIQ